MKINNKQWRQMSMFYACSLALTQIVPAALVSHWQFTNPTDDIRDYPNEVGSGSDMIWDSNTREPATFAADRTRFEQDYGTPRSTRLSASDASLNINTFSFSLIIDPTNVDDFKTFVQKESSAGSGFADYQRVGWTVQHTEHGNIEFVVRGTDPGTKDFYGGLTVTGDDSGFIAGAGWDDGVLFQIAGGYDAATGEMSLYVTELTIGLSSLVGVSDFRDAGATQDSSPLSLGSAMSDGDYVSVGAGFDVLDLRIYDSLESEATFLDVANQVIPEPSGIALGVLALSLLGVRRRRN